MTLSKLSTADRVYKGQSIFVCVTLLALIVLSAELMPWINKRINYYEKELFGKFEHVLGDTYF